MSNFFHMILYVSYFIFFSSYIFKILSFLSPLFFTTSLFSLSLFTTLHLHHISSESNQTYPNLIFSSLIKLNDDLQSKFEFKDEDFMSFFELQAYKMLFETSLLSENESFDTNSSSEINFIDKFCSDESIIEETNVENSLLKCKDVMNLELETEKSVKEEEVKDVKEEEVRLESGKGQNGKLGLKMESIDGVVKKEKEWRRTLACKLFEERHNNGDGVLDGEGMDHLWETYEKKSIEDDDDGDDDDDDDVEEQKLCCLQALKFSTKKMRFGISKPKLLKLSKAFRGFGRFYSVTKHHKN